MFTLMNMAGWSSVPPPAWPEVPAVQWMEP